MDDINFDKLKKKVLSAHGLDFSSYSQEYVKRRLRIRMLALGLPPDSFAKYMEVLDRTEGEYAELYDAFSVNVTEFFRDVPLWQVLYEKVFPRLIQEKKRGRVPGLKIWSCACSSGEEPYSIAILLSELMIRLPPAIPVSIIATDIDPDALEKARAGVYGDAALKNVAQMSPGWPGKYFSRVLPEPGVPQPAGLPVKYQLSDGIKKLVTFKKHNFLTDEPFEGVDVIFCRNAIIYLNKEAKHVLIEKFWNSLVPGGLFVMGMSELIFMVQGGCDFYAVEEREHIYRKGTRAGKGPPPLSGPERRQ